MTPERALEHDVVAALQDVVRDLVAAIAPHTQGCEVCKKMLSRHAAIIRVTKGMPTDPVASLNVLSAFDDGGALETIKAEAREWEIKWAHADAALTALRAENDRLTLAASESARTLQVEIEKTKDALRGVLGIVENCRQCVVKSEDGYKTMRDEDPLPWLDAALAALPQDGA